MREIERLWHFSKWIDGQDMFLMLNCIALNYDEHIDVLMANLNFFIFIQLPNMKWARERAHHCTDDGNSIGEWKTCMFCWQTYQFAFRESSHFDSSAHHEKTSYILKLIASRFLFFFCEIWWAMCPFRLTNERERQTRARDRPF